MSLYDKELFIRPDGKPMVFCLLAERESPEYGQYRQALVREVEWRGVVVLGRLGQDCNYSRSIQLGKKRATTAGAVREVQTPGCPAWLLQYHVITDSKILACLLLSLESLQLPAAYGLRRKNCT